jgi:hypothetical protein
MSNLVVENSTAIGTITGIEVTQNRRTVKNLSGINIGRAPQNNSVKIPLEPGGYTVIVTVTVTSPDGNSFQATESVWIEPGQDYQLQIYTSSLGNSINP